MRHNPIADYVRTNRKKLDFTQQDLADRSDVSLHFIRNLEQGKTSLMLDKVNELLNFFNAEVEVWERR